MSRALYLAIFATLAACEAVVGADFDDKTLVTSTGGQSAGGAGGASKLPLGQPCSDAVECASGYCADGVCCESACEGECAECAIAGMEGSCQLVAAGSACTGGLCDGAGTCATGNTRWAKRFGDGDAEEITACAFDATGALLVAGTFYGTLELGGDTLSQTALSNNKPWIFVAKFSPTGEHIWSHSFGTSEGVDVTDLAVDASGGPVITGTFDGVIDVGGSQLIGSSPRSGYVIKMDAMGSHQWHTVFDGTDLEARNGSVPDVLLQHVALDPSGDAYVAGAYGGQASIGSVVLTPGGDFGTYVTRISVGGNVAWARTSSSEPLGVVATAALVARPGGGAIIGGQFDITDAWFGTEPHLILDTISGNGGHDIFLAAYGDDGTVLWSRDFGDPASQFLEGLAIDPNGELLLVGSFTGQLNFGGGNVPHPSGNPKASLLIDLFAARLDLVPSHQYSDGFGPFQATTPLFARAAADGASNAILAGLQLGASVDFGAGTVAPKPFGWFVTKLAANATPLWSKAFGTVPPMSGAEVHQWLWDVATDPASGAVALCGFAVEGVDYGTGVLPQTSGMTDAIVAVLEP